jgi:phage shock protein PspC (stress-responsive transcriptional regulator)
MELYRSRLRRPRFTLAEIAGFVAGVAMALRWPILIMPTLSVVLILFFDRVGLSLTWALVMTSVVGLVLGFSLPLIVAR